MSRITVIFVCLALFAFLAAEASAQTQHFQFHWPTQSNAQVGIPMAVNPNVSGSPLVAGDEIGAFTSGGLCVGGIVWNGLSDVVITVWEDDSQTPQVDGIEAGDTIRYRVWRRSTDTEYRSVTVTYSQGSGVYFAGNTFILSSLTALAPPDVPTLASPANGATNQSTTLTLGWNPAPRAESYRVQVSTSSSFTSFVVDDSTVTTTSRQVTSLLNNTTYFWRVNATNSGGTGDWSTVWNFTTTLAAPVLASPANGATNQPTTLTLSWNAVTGAASYRIQVSTNSSFASFVVDDSTLTTTSRQVGPLSNNTTYFWRVNAKNTGGTSDWSTVWSLTTILAAPALASPSNGSVGLPTTFSVSWNVTSGAASYRLQVSTNSSFTSFVVNDSTLTTTSRQVGPLSNNTTYFWRVNAKNTGGTSDWSTVWNFTTTLAAPVLASPANGATNQPTTLTLSWNAVTGAASYRIQVSISPSFTSFVVDDSTLTTTSRQVGPLSNNTTYFWRVNAKNTGGTSDWSTVWSLTTTLAAPVLASPANGATNQPTTLTLSWNAVTGAASYRIQVSISPSFTSFVMNDTTTTTSRQVTSLLNNTTYFWRVNATNSGGTGDWSGIQSFTTVPLPPDLVTLLSPSNGSTLRPTTLTLSWNASTGATSYRLQVSTNSSFTSIVVDDSLMATTSRVIGPLVNATTYHWRVNAKNSGGSSNWSSVWNFTTIGTPMTHGVILRQGWNIISSFVQPQTTNLDTLTSGILNNLVIIRDDSGKVYWPGQSINDIRNWNYGEGYQVYMTAQDTLMIAGNELMPGMSPLSLIQGWHMITYMRNDSLVVDSALSTIAANIIIVKNNNGEVYWPALNNFNGIGKMKPGQGYQIKLSSASTLTYPANNQSSAGDVITSRFIASRFEEGMRNTSVPVHFSFMPNTGNNATIGIPGSTNPSISGTSLASGDEIGVFTAAGLCVGAVVWTGSSTAITVWGDDSQTPEIDGIQPGDKIHYRIWQQASNREFPKVVAGYSPGDSTYSTDGLSMLSSLVAGSTTNIKETRDIPKEFGLSQNYPNPFNPTTIITYGLPKTAMVRLEVFNIIGQRVAILVEEEQGPGYHRVLFGTRLPAGIYIYRLKADEFTQIRKMTLVR